MNMVRRPQKAKGSIVRGEEGKKSNGCTAPRGILWLLLHSYNFMLVTLEIGFGQKLLLDGRRLFGGNVFKNSARHVCKRILPKNVKT